MFTVLKRRMALMSRLQVNILYTLAYGWLFANKECRLKIQ